MLKVRFDRYIRLDRPGLSVGLSGHLHLPLGLSPTAKLLEWFTYFCLACNCGRHSRIQRRQNTSARYWTCRHSLRECESSLLNEPGGRHGPDRRRSRWFGVSALQSLGSLEDFVLALLLTIASTSHISVDNPSSSSACSFRTALRTFLTVLMQRSQTPPWWEPEGGLKIHLMCFCRKNPWICCTFHWEMAELSSLLPPKRFVQLSYRINSGVPRRAIKRLIELIKESVSIL